ncbi:hypothetical protein N781_17560 [Pontibacillus halophilus JSM 076056 = DSM 19796]|uniref:DUF4398 domain-containing protein n=2 Tax=Pontibacillus TaxID=289201 RepID=A0A0A5I8W0_9BACI|nr:hypothetical protein N781_17560 [Pontibacillus halophilus JSM 076056 = DSM 19796]
MILVLIALFVSACSNPSYDQAMQQGISHLADENYHKASVHFEQAQREKPKSTEASAYYTQANEMNKALQYHASDQYIAALSSLDEVISVPNGLQTLHNEASRLRDSIEEEQELQEEVKDEIKDIRAILETGNAALAKDRIETLTALDRQQQELNRYEEEIDELRSLISSLDSLYVESKDTEEYPEKESDARKEKEKEKEKEKKAQNTKAPDYLHYHNERFGYSFSYPSSLTMSSPPTNGDGSTWSNGDFELVAYGAYRVDDAMAIHDYYEQERQEIADIAYERQKDNWFVLSYVQKGVVTYEKFYLGPSHYVTFIITYPSSASDQYDPVTTHIANNFDPNL